MASSIVSSAAKELGSLVVGEVNYLYGVSDKIERLQRDFLWMRCFLEDTHNIEKQQKLVRIWVFEMKEFAYEAQEIIEWYVHQVAHHRQNGKCNTVKWFLCCLCDAQPLHDVGSRIDGLRSRISELIYNMHLYGVKPTELQERPQYNLPMRERLPTCHTKDYPIGMENHIEVVVTQLVERNEVKVVGIFGRGGLGKTTLAREVFSHKAIKEYFENNCVWVCISEKFERKTIFQEILLGLMCTSADNKDDITKNRIEKLRQEEVPQEICKVLHDKKCLVVLDDIWKAWDWDILMPAFHSIGNSDSKILITTHNKTLVQHAARCCPEGYSYPLGSLNDSDSWKLLARILLSKEENSGEAPTFYPSAHMHKLFHLLSFFVPSFFHPSKGNKTTSKEEGQGNEVKDMKTLAKEMLKHCNGLPLAIRTLGGVLLNKKTISEWQTVQKNISSYLMNNMNRERDSQESYAVLESSYDDLPYYLKPCFLYMRMFPEDYEIEAEVLFHLWEAEGLVTSSLDGGDELQEVVIDDIAEWYLNQLVERSLVQVEKCWPNGRIRSCRVHDIIRDMCLRKCKEGNSPYIIEQTQLVRASPIDRRRIHRYALHEPADADSLIDLSKSTPFIRYLLVFPHGNGWRRKVLSRKMRKFFSLLRVLYLADADIPLNPTVLGDFIHIRFICLRGSRQWYDLPQRIWDCKYLETLDLQDCWIRSLSNKFRELERLRHLYLPHFVELMGSQRLDLTICQLRQMETYKGLDVQKCPIRDLLKMTNLMNFSIRGSVRKWDLEDLLRSPVITSRRLANPLDLEMEAQLINEDPLIFAQMISQNIHFSSLKITGRIEVPLEGSVDPDVQIFPHTLVHVGLSHCEIGNDGISILGKLPLLKSLFLYEKAIEGNKMSFCDGSFPCLDYPFLCDMENLEEWEVGEDALPNLRFLKIRGCGALKLNPEGLPKSAHVDSQQRDPSKSLNEYVADFAVPFKYPFYSCQRSIGLM